MSMCQCNLDLVFFWKFPILSIKIILIRLSENLYKIGIELKIEQLKLLSEKKFRWGDFI